MRWNEVVTFLGVGEQYQDSAGAWHQGERVERLVYCNEYTIGAMAMAHLRSNTVRMANGNEPIDVGLRNEHMLEVRTVDYLGEDKCIFRGEEYEVMYITGAGDTRLITIGQRFGTA